MQTAVPARRQRRSILGPTRRRRRPRTRADLRRRRDRADDNGLRRAILQRDPRDADVAVEESLARHAVTGGQVGLGQVPALLVLHRIGILDALLYPAAARSA